MKILYTKKFANGTYLDVTISEYNSMLGFQYRYTKKHGLEFSLSLFRICVEKLYTPF